MTLTYRNQTFGLTTTCLYEKNTEQKGSDMELIHLLIFLVLLPIFCQDREVKQPNKTQTVVLLLSGFVALSTGAVIALARHI